MIKNNTSGHSKSLQDEVERARALDCTKSIHCESPAGSGKTTLLTDRFLKLLSKTGHPNQLLALTFTNKAAGQMRQRIWDALKEAEKGGEGLNERRTAAQKALKRHADKTDLLYAPDGLRIKTFHSLCHAIVRSSPLEAGVPADISIIEGIEYETLLLQVTDETLQKIASLKNGNQKKAAMERWLLRTNNNWSSLRSDCINLIKKRDYLKDLIGLLGVNKDIQTFKKSSNESLGFLIGSLMEKTRFGLLSTDLGKNWRVFAQCLNSIQNDNFPDQLPEPIWSNLPQWQSIAHFLTTKDGKPRKRFEKGFNKRPEAAWCRTLPLEVCQMLNDIKTLPADGYDEDQILAIYDLIIILGEVISAWQQMCWEKGVIDFVGLELACLKVLDHTPIPNIQFIIDSKIQHILVDEFQDTSRNQWELLQKLCSGWTVGDGRTLFLVGDPKQSIYAFRKAEVSLFAEAKKGGLPIPGQRRLQLDAIILKNNFRSRPGLVEWTNRIFGETVMAHPRVDVDEVPFSSATASLTGEHKLSMAIFIQNKTLPDPYIAEANWLARCIERLNNEIEKDESIGILLFARTRLLLYLEALTQIGIPVKVTEGLRLADSIEVMSMHQMVRALVRPHDDIAWACLMRLPWCWCSPDLLCGIWQQQNLAWVDKIAAFVKSDSEAELVKRWWEVLKEAQMKMGREPISKIVKDAWLKIEGAYKLTCLLGIESVGNVLRYLEILEESEQYIPEETLTRVEQAMENAYMPSAPEASRSRIELMTVHKAKGLEFDYVFCPYTDWDPLGGGRTDRPPYLMETLVKGSGQGVLALRKDQRHKDEDLIYRLLLKRRREKRQAEAKRLFYVAATRAKKGLYLSGVAQIKDERVYARCKDSPLSHILKHEGIGEWAMDSIDFTNFKKTGTEGILIQLNPVFPKDENLHTSQNTPPPPLPKPLEFSPEILPYKVISPSEKEGRIEMPEKDRTLQIDIIKRARGIVIHQIFACISEGYRLPSEKAVASAIYREGVNLKEAESMAGSVLKEVKLCMDEPTCAWIIRADHPEAYSEWSIEDTPETATIRSGIIDRLIFDGRKWWIIDYKSVQTQTEASEDIFFAQQAMLYKPQMDSYRAMVSNWRGVQKDEILMLLYFTAFQRPYYYKNS